MRDTVPYAWKSLTRQRLKLAISVAGLAAALILMMLILGFRTGLYASVAAYVDHAGADLFVAQQGATGLVASSSAVPAELAESIREESGASSMTAVTIADVIFKHEDRKTPVILVGYEPGRQLGGPWSVVAGTEPRADEAQILLDRWLAEENDIAVGQTVSVLGQDLTVVGLTGGTSNWMSPFLFLPASVLQDALDSPEVVSFFLVQLPEDADRGRVVDRIEERLEDVHVMQPATLAGHDREVLAAVMETPLLVMLGISVIIGTAVLGLTSYTAALDRMREYGVLKAVGASPANMRAWMLREGLYRALLGYLAGGVGAVFAAWLVELLWPKFTVLITPEAFGVVELILVVMVGFGSLLPLRRVESLDPAVVFRA